MEDVYSVLKERLGKEAANEFRKFLTEKGMNEEQLYIMKSNEIVDLFREFSNKTGIQIDAM